MSEEEKKSKLKSLIEDYEIGYKESKYEGDVEEYKSLKETHKLLKDTLNYIEKLQKELDKKDKVIKQLEEDISNMYDEKVVRNILEDECGLSKFEIDEILN